MRISLCMVVKDEERHIGDCLGPIVDLFDDVVVMDTGSSDRTVELLRDRFGITAVPASLATRECSSATPARNQAAARARHPWLLKLDADERLSRDAIERLLAQPEPSEHAGFFCTWTTFGNGAALEDYKLILSRSHIPHAGVVHEAQQHVLRERGLSADWLHGVTLLHYPDVERLSIKAALYRERLVCALDREPKWYRHHWFLGYRHFCDGELEDAARCLETVCSALPPQFPVECLNSHIVLADIHARRGNSSAASAVLRAGIDFFKTVADDFEVRVNARISPWFARALAAAERGDLAAIRSYPFAH